MLRSIVAASFVADPEHFALGGRDFQGDIGRARVLGDVPLNVFPQAISAARVNLNITRRSHATVPGSSFFSDPSDGAHLLRFAFCKRLETLEEAGERLRRAALDILELSRFSYS